MFSYAAYLLSQIRPLEWMALLAAGGLVLLTHIVGQAAGRSPRCPLTVKLAGVYGIFILLITLLSREAGSGGRAELVPFWSWYRVLALHRSGLLWQILLNILLFAPLGGLLALGGWRKRRIVLTGALLSVGVEAAQLVFRLGLFEWDDMIHNTLGALLGAVVALWIRDGGVTGEEPVGRHLRREEPLGGGRWIRLAIVVCTLLIWSNSLRNADQSSAQSGALFALLQPHLAPFGLDGALGHTLLRKAAHMTEYAVLGLLWSGELAKAGGRITFKRAALRWQTCVLTALADETVQLFVPGRSGQVQDVWIDGVGALLAVAAGSLLLARLARRRQRREQERWTGR